jgi:hypothetical protein
MRRWRVFIAVLALPLGACAIRGELGNIGFDLGTVDPLYEFESGDRVLLGSRLCPEIDEVLHEDGSTRPIFAGEKATVRACFDESVV